MLLKPCPPSHNLPCVTAGRLFQVEYAIAAIQNAAAAVGVLTAHGIVIAGEKKVRRCG